MSLPRVAVIGVGCVGGILAAALETADGFDHAKATALDEPCAARRAGS